MSNSVDNFFILSI